MKSVRIGLIGDYDPQVVAHVRIPRALALAGQAAGCVVDPVWLPTSRITADTTDRLAAYDGLWCVPASPYASMEGALCAIQYARERPVPFLGTCGGFQHALLEYARNVLGLRDADHAESNPRGAVLVVTPLECALRGVQGVIHLAPGSRSRNIYGQDSVVEEYNCGFGLNPAYRAALDTGLLRVTGADDERNARVVELAGHPFFLATLFQPERSAATGKPHPLIEAYLHAVMADA